MPTPITITEENYHLLYHGRLVFLDFDGRYRNVLESNFKVKDAGIFNGVSLSDTNTIGILIEMPRVEGELKRYPDVFLRDEVEAEQKKTLGETLIRLRATRKVLERIGDIDRLVEVETEGIKTCELLDEIDPVYEVAEVAGYERSFWGSYPTRNTIKTLKPRIF